MKRLTKKDDGVYIANCDNCPKRGNCYDSTDCEDVLVDRLAAYEDAEEAGLLIRLACKYGDTVWFIKSAFTMAASPIEGNHVSIRGMDCDGDIMYAAIITYNDKKTERRFKSSDMGKTVFLTQEEAEAALAGEEKEVDKKTAASEKGPTFGISTAKRQGATYY